MSLSTRVEQTECEDFIFGSSGSGLRYLWHSSTYWVLLGPQTAASLYIHQNDVCKTLQPEVM